MKLRSAVVALNSYLMVVMQILFGTTLQGRDIPIVHRVIKVSMYYILLVFVCDLIDESKRCRIHAMHKLMSCITWSLISIVIAFFGLHQSMNLLPFLLDHYCMLSTFFSWTLPKSNVETSA